MAKVRELLPEVNRVSRLPIPASELKVALQCGGSDGFSGITANPALGKASDLLVGLGATAVLAETPKITGRAAAAASRRGEGRRQADRPHPLVEGVHGDERRSMDNKPSPGNKQGGLTTILEKSLGAAAKGGSTPLADVLAYGEVGPHPVSSSWTHPGTMRLRHRADCGGLPVRRVHHGAGSAFGSKPAPTLKVATNDRLYAPMAGDMDINCGDIVSQGGSLAEKGSRPWT